MRIAIVGTGPMGLYCFKYLTAQTSPLEIHLYESGPRLGVGLPYAPETTDRTMLANIASIEIPPLTETYLAWLRRCPPDYLESYGLALESLDERSFTPRLMLGDYFHAQMMALIAKARAAGHRIKARASCRVLDLRLEGQRMRLLLAQGPAPLLHDKVILATGHDFLQAPAASAHYFSDPWSRLIQTPLPAARIGILGTSLSAMDAATTIAAQHGTFEITGETVRFLPKTQGLQISLMSRSGILPEADFYAPLPYTPLKKMTPQALRAASCSASPFLAAFDLFKDEITSEDPAWAQAIGLDGLTPEGFKKAYFSPRREQDPFLCAKANLAEVEANHKARKTVRWRDAILRMHVPFDALVREFSAADRARFELSLKKVFIDNYAAVPPLAIRRLLALKAAGVLSILPLGESYQMHRAADHTLVETAEASHRFDVFVDARGQQPRRSKDLPFPSLRGALLRAGYASPRLAEDCALLGLEGYENRLYLAALPYLMQDHPFVQGITACADLAEEIAKSARTPLLRSSNFPTSILALPKAFNARSVFTPTVR